ncbi:major facilitator superfamily transporter [Tritrichomonas foetus]|uniref:Major facilitator superfamily transporter n=1 Tax=Tritrichomonas foetus TaxID=1144522 RepID=A0A1J4JUE7_9EUKA|nr:major facilitator superfamily transporter [Tritrichomonas foetus]|eukprot:OHT01142.1 major facilitator superfamily transporter [Tritrichomonas foetus]
MIELFLNDLNNFFFISFFWVVYPMPGFFRKELLYLCSIIIGSMEIGWVITFVSPSLPLIKEEFPGLTSFETSAFQAIPALTAIVGTYWANYLMLKLSRKFALIINSCCGTVFWLLLLTMSKKFFWISLIIRALQGIVMGAYSTIDPVYVAEIAPPERIGFYGIINSMCISFGHCSFNLVGAIHSWRANVYFGAGFCALQAFTCLFVPHSPIDLAHKKNPKNTDENLHMMSVEDDYNEDSNKDIDPESYKSTVNIKKRSLFQKFYLKPMIIGLGLVILQQFAGVNAMVANMSSLLNAAGLDAIDSSIQASIATCAEFFSGFLSAFIMDKFGRRNIFIFSCCGACLSMIIFSLNTKLSLSPIIPVIILFCYMFSFGIGLANIPWIIVPEMFDDDVRSTANSICCSINWLSASIVTFCYPFMAKTLTDFGSLLFFAAMCLISLLFGIFLVPNDPQKYRFVNESSDCKSYAGVIKPNEIENDGTKEIPSEL